MRNTRFFKVEDNNIQFLTGLDEQYQTMRS